MGKVNESFGMCDKPVVAQDKLVIWNARWANCCTRQADCTSVRATSTPFAQQVHIFLQDKPSLQFSCHFITVWDNQDDELIFCTIFCIFPPMTQQTTYLLPTYYCQFNVKGGIVCVCVLYFRTPLIEQYIFLSFLQLYQSACTDRDTFMCVYWALW